MTTLEAILILIGSILWAAQIARWASTPQPVPDRPAPKMSDDDAYRLLIDGFRQLSEDVQSGKPVRVTKSECEVTPDGPMHTATSGHLVNGEFVPEENGAGK